MRTDFAPQHCRTCGFSAPFFGSAKGSGSIEIGFSSPTSSVKLPSPVIHPPSICFDDVEFEPDGRRPAVGPVDLRSIVSAEKHAIGLQHLTSAHIHQTGHQSLQHETQ